MKHKNEHAKEIINEKHVNKIRSLEIVTKPKDYSKSPNMVAFPPKLLDSGASNECPSSPCNHHQGTKSLTSCESPHLHQKQKVGTLVPIFLGLRGLAFNGTQTFLLAKLI